MGSLWQDQSFFKNLLTPFIQFEGRTHNITSVYILLVYRFLLNQQGEVR